ncbi:MAG TPA: type II toxin-antitoxin system VapC family toxin [Longimicrobiaceae bacterium]|nr:type II toxin-antitoxin system VapC family toxin [Longimicrobiaceae bacterium]
MTGQRLLLDTHALLWWVANGPALSVGADAAIGESTNEVYVSAASAWEVTTKARIGKLVAGPLAADFCAEVRRQGFLPLPITIEHGQRAGNLPGHHRDPFDRMLIAQAHAEGLTLVSNEQIFDRYGVTRLW